jgi:hypothetical protein
LGILVSRIRQMKRELRTLETRLDEAEDRNWEAREAQERANFFRSARRRHYPPRRQIASASLLR